MTIVNQSLPEPGDRLELNVYQCGHSGELQLALERADDRYRVHGPRSIRAGKRVLHHPVTPQDKRMLRRWLGLDEGSDQ